MKVGKTLAALAVVCAVGLAGCGRGGDSSAETESGTEVPEGAATGEISIWAMGEEAERLPEIAEEFTKENPDAKVTVTSIPWADVITKVQTAVASGAVPDAIMVGTSHMATIVDTGGLQPVPDGLISEDDFFKGAMGSATADGSTYGVPWYVETRVMYYRSDIADANSLKVPTNWDELVDFAKGYQHAGAEYGIALPVGAAEDSTQVILPFFAEAGGILLEGDNWDFDSDAMVSAIEYYADFFKQGLAPTSGYGDGQTAAFVDGTNPIFISGPWMVNVLAEIAGDDWVENSVGTAVVPSGSANNDSYIGGAHLAVFEDAKNADGAWKFIAWLAESGTQQKWYDLTSDLPALKSAWDYAPLQDNPRIVVLGEQLENTIAPPSVPSWNELADQLENDAEKVANGSMTADEAAKDVQSKAEKLGTGWKK